MDTRGIQVPQRSRFYRDLSIIHSANDSSVFPFVFSSRSSIFFFSSYSFCTSCVSVLTRIQKHRTISRVKRELSFETFLSFQRVKTRSLVSDPRKNARIPSRFPLDFPKKKKKKSSSIIFSFLSYLRKREKKKKISSTVPFRHRSQHPPQQRELTRPIRLCTSHLRCRVSASRMSRSRRFFRHFHALPRDRGGASFEHYHSNTEALSIIHRGSTGPETRRAIKLWGQFVRRITSAAKGKETRGEERRGGGGRLTWGARLHFPSSSSSSPLI